MARYTKKDADGRYYIESVNGKLESDKFGHTYGEAIDRFAELENADVVPRAEVEYWKEQCFHACMNNGCLDKAIVKAAVAREIFEEIEECAESWCGDYYISIEKLYELKKKYTEGQK